MRYDRFCSLALVAGTAILSLSCDEDGATDPEVPVPGSALVLFDTPNSGEGAVMLTMRGPAVPELRSGSDAYVVYSKTLPDGSARAIVLGHLADGVLLTADVEDLNRLAEYEVTLDQVSSRESALRSDLTGFSISLEQPGAE